jgi:asparagine synthase (glutamine-hydrolysing)
MVKPTIPAIIEMPSIDALNDVARHVSADAYWTGEGGDHLFFQMKSPLGAADYIQRHGIGCGLAPVIRDAARLAQISYWDALCMGLKLGRSKAPWCPEEDMHGSRGFLNPDVLQSHSVEDIAHPWTEQAEYVPKGKQYQIRYLSEVVNRERPLSDFEYADAHHPLLSQPLMELCLRIPVYSLLNGGRQRGLARTAFQSTVPIEITDRETKGGTTAYLLRLLRQNQPYICDLLLDGLLVRQGILSRKALEPCVLHTQPMRGEQLFPLLASIAAEVWARAWSFPVRRAIT